MENNLLHNEERKQNEAETKEKKLFFTTSDLMELMNKSSEGNFELQRQMPDGSTKKADESELALANLQSKIKQTAHILSNMTPEEKFEWAKDQRKEGNLLFSESKYKEAMDVYLTCLVAMDKLLPSKKSTDSEQSKDTNNMNTDDNEVDKRKKVEDEIQLPVLLNLSLCTLKLSLLSKTEEFCNLALNIPSARTNPKVYFRRGKARMLMGHYHGARIDLDLALQILMDNEANIRQDVAKREKEAVLRELKKLDGLEKSAKVNSKKQKRAMKVLLGGEINTKIKVSPEGDANKKIDHNTRNKIIGNKSSGFNDQVDSRGLYYNMGKQRQFSNLRMERKGLKMDTIVKSNHVERGKEIYNRAGIILFIFFYLLLAHIWYLFIRS